MIGPSSQAFYKMDENNIKILCEDPTQNATGALTEELAPEPVEEDTLRPKLAQNTEAR